MPKDLHDLLSSRFNKNHRAKKAKACQVVSWFVQIIIWWVGEVWLIIVLFWAARAIFQQFVGCHRYRWQDRKFRPMLGRCGEWAISKDWKVDRVKIFFFQINWWYASIIDFSRVVLCTTISVHTRDWILFDSRYRLDLGVTYTKTIHSPYNAIAANLQLYEKILVQLIYIFL
jgi:hypothetical protein